MDSTVKVLRRSRSVRRETPRVEPESRPEPGIALGRVLEGAGGRWRVRTGTGEVWATLDASVDPLLVEEARGSGARVLLEPGADGPVLVGVLQTSRALRIDRSGVVEAEVERFSVQARTEAVLKTLAAYLRLDRGDAELRGVKTLVRAREMAKVLARIISLN